jgi:hypothetical protein
MALTDSQMAMWETVVALVHADGEVHTEEDKFLTERFEKLPVTPEQNKSYSSISINQETPESSFSKSLSLLIALS